MVKITWFTVAMLIIASRCDASETVFASLGGVELVAVPEPSDGRFAAATVKLRTIDPNASIEFLTNMSFRGAVLQTWTGGDLGMATVLGPPGPSEFYPEAWNQFDSHLWISESMIDFGTFDFSETNDGSIDLTDFDLPVVNETIAPIGGYGNIEMEKVSDAFRLKLFFRGNSVDLAYLVMPTRGSDDTVECAPFLCRIDITVGALGTGFIDAGQNDGAAFGYNGNPRVVIPFVPEPETKLTITFLYGFLFVRRTMRCKPGSSK